MAQVSIKKPGGPGGLFLGLPTNQQLSCHVSGREGGCGHGREQEIPPDSVYVELLWDLFIGLKVYTFCRWQLS